MIMSVKIVIIIIHQSSIDPVDLLVSLPVRLSLQVISAKTKSKCRFLRPKQARSLMSFPQKFRLKKIRPERAPSGLTNTPACVPRTPLLTKPRSTASNSKNAHRHHYSGQRDHRLAPPALTG
jgi:hypothetical protein